jgi:hypothetical protein
MYHRKFLGHLHAFQDIFMHRRIFPGITYHPLPFQDYYRLLRTSTCNSGHLQTSQDILKHPRILTDIPGHIKAVHPETSLHCKPDARIRIGKGGSF